jgi:cell wall-associated NlpC family hydrolase
MEAKGIAAIAQAFFQYGPFAILAFLFFHVFRLMKQLKTSSREFQIVLKRNLMIYDVFIAALIVVCVVYWIYYFSVPRYFAGEILNVDEGEYQIKSADIFLITYSKGDEYKIEWVWKKDKYKPDARINFTHGTSTSPEKSFYLYSDIIKEGYCRLVYDKNEGWLKYRNEKLPIIPKIAINTLNQYRNSGHLFAEQKIFDSDKELKQLMAIDFNVRLQALERLLKEASDRQKIEIIAKGMNLIKNSKLPGKNISISPINSDFLLASLLALMNNTDKNTKFEDWQRILGDNGLCEIIASAASKDSNIKNQSLKFMSDYKKELIPVLEAQLKDTTKKEDNAFLEGGVLFYSKVANELDPLRKQTAIMSNPKLSEILDEEARLRDIESKAKDAAKRSGQLKTVVDLVFKLKASNINYKWGGKNETEGFDSSGFIAYVFAKAGLLENPKKYWSGEIKAKIGKKLSICKPQEIGDLVFYEGGAVMFYLGKDMAIGMIENGISVRGYLNMSAEPIQVNRVQYR